MTAPDDGQRRYGDRPAFGIPSFVLGAFLMVAGVVMKHIDHVSDTFAVVTIAIGGILIPGSRMIDAIRFWRRNGNGNGNGNGGART